MLEFVKTCVNKCKLHTSKVPIGINDINIEQN